MARILAVDWDRHEARYVLATASGGKVKVEAVEAVPLVDVAEGGAEPHPDLSGSLGAALADQKTGRLATLVGVERSGIELLHFTLPPAKDKVYAGLGKERRLTAGYVAGKALDDHFFGLLADQ